MTDRDSVAADSHPAGGRLGLLERSTLTAAQRELADRITVTRVAAGRRSGYRAALDDGRLIGPFNALLRVPPIAERQLDWVEAIATSGLSATARETAILTVAAQWQATYVLDAHAQAARVAGLSDEAVSELVAGRAPVDVADFDRLAHSIALALVRDHEVPDDLYREFMSRYGETLAVVLLSLIGQYLATCAVVTCFRVPPPAM